MPKLFFFFGPLLPFSGTKAQFSPSVFHLQIAIFSISLMLWVQSSLYLLWFCPVCDFSINSSSSFAGYSGLASKWNFPGDACLIGCWTRSNLKTNLLLSAVHTRTRAHNDQCVLCCDSDIPSCSKNINLSLWSVASLSFLLIRLFLVPWTWFVSFLVSFLYRWFLPF